VKASALNVRQGPGTSYSIINQLSNGAKVNIIKEESGWYQIKLANGSTGWVSGTYVNVNTTIASRGGLSEIQLRQLQITAMCPV